MSPKFGRKFDREGQKIKKNWPFSSICRLNLLAKYSEPKKQMAKKVSSRSFKSLKFEFVCNQIRPL